MWRCGLILLMLASTALADPQRVTIRTADDVTLNGKRYPRAATPVVLFHGLATNLNCFDLPGHSLAGELADRGYDVWLINLRPVGSFDDLALYDVPATLNHVRRVTRRKAFLIGHSMGGMILYAHLQGARWIRTRHGRRVGADPALADQRQAAARGLITLCSPPRLAWAPGKRNPVLGWLARSRLVATLLRRTDRLPVGRLLRFAGPQVSRRLLDGSGLVLERRNVDPTTRRAFASRATGSLPSQTARQFLDGIRHATLREFHTADPGRKPYVYADHLDRVRLPVLVISATRDRLVDHTVVRRQGYQRLGSRDKTYVAAKDFGHVDLLIGRRAAREVYPVIGDWLARR